MRKLFSRQVSRNHRVLSRLIAISFYVARSVGMEYVGRLEAVDPAQCQRDLREDGVLVGEVYPKSLQRGDGVRVDGLDDQEPVRLQLAPA